MYVIFYNCYYYKELKSYIPKWLETEQSNKKRRGYESPSKLKSDKKDTSLLSSASLIANTHTWKKNTPSHRKMNSSFVSTNDNSSSSKKQLFLSSEKKLFRLEQNQSFVAGMRHLSESDETDDVSMCQSMFLQEKDPEGCYGEERVEEIC